MLSEPLVEISTGASRCVLAPSLGASLMALTLDGLEVLRPGDPSSGDPLTSSGFVMLPFCNRVPHGAEWAGVTLHLPPDPAGAPLALHGHGWRSAWQTTRISSSEIELRYSHPFDEWPWSYLAVQRIALMDDRLDIAIEVSNLSPTAMPCGVGMHPYFSLNPDGMVDTRASRCLWPDRHGIAALPRKWQPGRTRMSNLPACDIFLLDERTSLSVGTEHTPVRLIAEEVAGWHLYRPVSGGFFCVEPVNHRPGVCPPLVPSGGTKRWRCRISRPAPDEPAFEPPNAL